jgi:hypothetical protein
VFRFECERVKENEKKVKLNKAIQTELKSVCSSKQGKPVTSRTNAERVGFLNTLH